MKLAEEIRKKGFSGGIKAEVSLSDYTTYRIGGPAEALVEPSCEKDIEIIINYIYENDIPLYVIGGGSKVLAPDEGVRGIVLHMGDLFSKIDFREGEMVALAGAANSAIAERAAREGFRGLEWIYDIPGRVGGSLVQNAGMNECSISSHLREVTFFRSDCKITAAGKEDIQFGYRSSSFKSWGDTVIVSAGFRFEEEGPPEEILRTMEEIKQKRHGKFPVSSPTCGSVFKRPEGHYPGRLIEDCGLGGRKAGGARISTVHHNFIVNRGGATARDVKALVDLITETVEEKTGIVLERELIYLEETVSKASRLL